MIDYQKELNPAQYTAVMHESGPALIIAGAGTGKTRTLVYRVARLVEQGITPREILLLTFTRRAAQEMLVRATRLLQNKNIAHVAGGTFHSFAHATLRRFGKKISLSPNFTILDRADEEDVIQHLRTECGFTQRGRRFPQKATIAEIFSKTANMMATMEETVTKYFPHFTHEHDALWKLNEMYFLYKKEHNLCDYDDLLLQLLAMLEREPLVAERLSSEFRHIMVDEYQDTNRLQAEVLKRLAVVRKNIVAVGDDAQSIYSFRGASFRNIMDFPKDFPGARIITLEQNYRSTQPILNVANKMIEQSSERYKKDLFSRKTEGNAPIVVACSDEAEQSRFVADRILELREEGVPLEHVAVLFRSSFHSFDLETELSRRNIPFVKYGGFKFMETAHVKDVIGHLRFFLNPKDAVSAERILLLREGIGPVHARTIIQEFEKTQSLADAIANARVPARAKEGLEQLARLMEKLATLSTPAEHTAAVVKYIEPLVVEKYYDDFSKRVRDLEHLCGIAARFKNLDRFLAHLSIDPPQSIKDVEGVENEEEPLVLSTIHSAKGLEWHTVFVIWVLDGFFPADYSFSNEEELEEERRLLYVAMTRAQEGLYLTYPMEIDFSRGPSVFGRPSKFLEGIPPEILPIAFSAESPDQTPD